MNKAAITKHEIYNKLIDFSEQDLNEIDKYIDFLRFKNKSMEKKTIRLQGILKEFDIDFSDLKNFKKAAWEHVDQEFSNDNK